MGNPAPASRSKFSKGDPKSKHRHSGSVSSFYLSSEDLASSNVDANSPVSSVSSSSVSLKDKKPKRRTRSSLGGTEDFIKELDFLSPSLNKKAVECLTPKERAKPSLRSQLAAPSQASAAVGTVPSVQKGSIRTSVVGAEEDVPLGCLPVSEKSDAAHECSNLASSGVEMSRAVNKGGFLGGSGEAAYSGNGMKALPGNAENGSTVVAKNGEAQCSTENEQSASAASRVHNDSFEVGQKEIPDAVVGDNEFCEASAEDLPDPDCASPEASTTNSFEHVNDEGSSSARSIAVPPVGKGSAAATSNGRPLSEDPDDCKVKQVEEKVSVQKRIEQLERIARGKPFHFRSQSLSLPRPFEISPARHHEAEGSKGKKMPLYQAPLDSKIASGKNQSDKADPEKEESPVAKSDVMKSSVGGVTSQAVAIVKLVGQKIVAQMARSSDDCGSEETGASQFNESETNGKGCTPAAISIEDSHLPGGKELNAVGLVGHMGSHADSEKCSGPESSAASVERETTSIPPGDAVLKPDKSSETTNYANSTNHAVHSGKQNLGKSTGDRDSESKQQAPSGIVEEHVAGTSNDCVKSGPAHDGAVVAASCASASTDNDGMKPSLPPECLDKDVISIPEIAKQAGHVYPEASTTRIVSETQKARSATEVPSHESGPGSGERSCQDDETSVLLSKQPAVDPLFVDSQQDRLWEMHSQELTLRDGESSGREVRESSAQDDDPGQFANGTPTHAEASVSGTTPNGTAQSDKSVKIDRPRTPLRSLLAEEEAAERGPGGESTRSTTPQNQISSPRGNLFKRIVSGGRNSPTKQTPSSQFTPKTQPAAKPFLSSCICCSVK